MICYLYKKKKIFICIYSKIVLFILNMKYIKQVDQPGGAGQPGCTDAASYCGLRDSLFPDRRSMGFPFDRQPRSGVDTLQQFLTPNMFVKDVAIQFSNRTVRPQQSGTGTSSQGNRPSAGNRPGSGQSNRPGGRN